MADEAAVPDGHGVDGTQAAGVRCNLVEVVQDQLLARVRDVQAVEAHAVGTLQEFAHRFTREAQLQQVDGAVEIPQALHVAFALVHGGRERRHDAITYEAHQKGLCSIAHPYSSFDNGTRRTGTRWAPAACRVIGITVQEMFIYCTDVLMTNKRRRRRPPLRAARLISAAASRTVPQRLLGARGQGPPDPPGRAGRPEPPWPATRRRSPGH
ncbi:hypothetical protein D9M72_319220 [compost metagenome]